MVEAGQGFHAAGASRNLRRQGHRRPSGVTRTHVGLKDGRGASSGEVRGRVQAAWPHPTLLPGGTCG